jgi:MFS family permease
MTIPKYILPSIVIAQFCCTSLWFASNAVMNDLILNFNLSITALGDLTAAVQFGFISGTLVFALLAIADRFSPSRVFFASALVGALFNLAVVLDGQTLISLVVLRFMTGFFLAGIYPVGMKIAADYYDKGLGRSLGYLVGALVLGTALPHLLKVFTLALPWRLVLILTTGLAVLGGLIIITLVPDGPFRRAGQKIKLNTFTQIFRRPAFRAAAFGYFGHMWELYTFWAFVPVMLAGWLLKHPDIELQVSLWSFLIIGTGGLACMIGGVLAQRIGVKNIAFGALLLSGICCLLVPFVLQSNSVFLLLLFFLFWGAFVVADSPLFSTLVAQNADPQIKGTALTIVNCIGFAITIVSIQLVTYLFIYTASNLVFTSLAIGPALGLWALNRREVNPDN